MTTHEASRWGSRGVGQCQLGSGAPSTTRLGTLLKSADARSPKYAPHGDCVSKHSMDDQKITTYFAAKKKNINQTTLFGR